MDPDVILFDEPTSALDPTMVGEVQAVIGELATTGKTLMIVTHEMAFARAICNRVFYMDEGGIYEDGAPEQVFDNPVRENTRRFVRRLKVLEIGIKDRNYDYLGIVSDIERYGMRNQIPPVKTHHVQLAFEELVQLIVPTLSDPGLSVVVEWSEALQEATLTTRYNGPAMDATARADTLVNSVLHASATQITYAWDEGTELPNQIKVTIR